MKINYDNTDSVGEYLQGSIIRKMYTADGFEGGLVIIFEKNWKVGIYIMGYTELGDWVELFMHEEELYYYKHFSELDKINKVLRDNNFKEIDDFIWE